MYYIRKLSKKTNLYKFKQPDTIGEINADILKQELGTTGDTLSFWKCETLEETKDAMKAILLSTTSIDTSQFIILDDELLDRYKIEVDNESPGLTAYLGFENLHVDFCALTYEKIGFMLEMIKEISLDEKRTPELKKDAVIEYINEVLEDRLINTSALKDELRKSIVKRCSSGLLLGV